MSTARVLHLPSAVEYRRAALDYQFRMHTGVKDMALREAMEECWKLARVALKLARLVPEESRLTPFLVALQERRNAKALLRSLRGLT